MSVGSSTGAAGLTGRPGPDRRRRCTVRRVSPEPQRIDVPVAGGTLATYRWPGDGPVVLAAHGITSNHRSWGLVAQALDGAATLVAPDLRGRGRSNGLPGPYAVAQHADDCAAVLDHLGAEAAVVTGHSMGGFVATALATRHPERVRAVVLVDGGPPLHVPPGVDVDAALAATLGPAMQRLDMTFEDRGAYRAFWQQHPSFARIWSAEVDAHVQHDLIGEPPHMRSSCVKEAVRVNGRELLADEAVRIAVRDVACPLVLLWAPRGMVDDPGGLYAEERLGGLEHELVPDTNHYSILLGEPGAKRVAAAIRRLL
jgi:pimeloyl-ACP methyl ester carboxylesterase